MHHHTNAILFQQPLHLFKIFTTFANHLIIGSETRACATKINFGKPYLFLHKFNHNLSASAGMSLLKPHWVLKPQYRRASSKGRETEKGNAMMGRRHYLTFSAPSGGTGCETSITSEPPILMYSLSVPSPGLLKSISCAANLPLPSDMYWSQGAGLPVSSP